MKDKEIEKVLIDCMQMKHQLYDFCIECLNKIYGDKSQAAINAFDEGIEFYNYNGCIQSLECIESNLQREEKLKQN